MATHLIMWMLLAALSLEIQFVKTVDPSRTIILTQYSDSGDLAWLNNMINQLKKEKNDLLLGPINYSLGNITSQISTLQSCRVWILELLTEYLRLELENISLLTHKGKPILGCRNNRLKQFISTFQTINNHLILRIQKAVEDVTNLNSHVTALKNEDDKHNLKIREAEEKAKNSKKVYRKNYRIIRKKITWFEAVRACNEMHMNMATLRNKEESDAFKAQLNQEGLGEFDIWIGGTMREESGLGWYWIPDGEKIKYTDWDANQPDNWHNEYCISYRRRKNTWAWNDLTCNGTEYHYFGCESFTES